MCTRPITIKNNSVLRDGSTPSVLTVPCGHCLECQKKNRDSYELRFYEEFKLCRKHWPACSHFFITLTYNNDNVPFYEEGDVRHYCADFSDVQKCLKLLRKYLNCGIRYFAVVEFGEQRGRVHYHLYLITENFISEPYMLFLLQTKCWCRYENKKNVGSRGFVKNIAIRKTDGQRRTDYNCVRYICKYLTKYDNASEFTGSQSLRVRCSLGFGLGPNHENPFHHSELALGFVFLPYSLTNRYYIPSIYYNVYMARYDDIKKNARYVEYAEYIENQVYEAFFSTDISITSLSDVNSQVQSFLHSKYFPLPEYQSIKFDRLVLSSIHLIRQLPNLHLNDFFKKYKETIRCIYLLSFNYDVDEFFTDKSYTDNINFEYEFYKIRTQYIEDDLIDCMLYVLPYLDRVKNGYYLSTGVSVVDPYLYCDVVYLFNLLTFYIKTQQSLNNKLSLIVQSEDEKKSNYFKRLYYEEINLSKSPRRNLKELRSPKRWCDSYWHHTQESRNKKYVSETYCPF